MTWFKVDDTFNQHSRVAALESGRHFAEAIALWTLAGSWSAQQLTEGFIPTQQLRRLVPFKAAPAASELVRVGLWDEVDGGYQFHDWLDYQPTKDEVETKREKSKCRSRKYRERKTIKQLDASVTRDFDVTQRVASRPRHAPPSRPVPSQLQPTSLTCVADARAPELGTVSAETARAEYLARWSKVSKTQPPLVARGPGASVWLDLAREVTDPAGLTKLLDAAFADDFVGSTGWTPNAIRGAAQRLLTQGPKAKHSGPARPRTAAEFAAEIQQHGAETNEF